MKNKLSKKRIISLIGLFCISLILTVFLFMNAVLLFKSYKNPNQIPNIGKYIPLQVCTNSMTPYFDAGDLVIFKKKIHKNIKIGDIVALSMTKNKKSEIIVTKIIDIIYKDNKMFIKTKFENDENKYNELLISSEMIIGVYNKKIRGLGKFTTFMSSTEGLVICIAIAFIAFYATTSIREKKLQKNSIEEKLDLNSEIEIL